MSERKSVTTTPRREPIPYLTNDANKLKHEESFKFSTSVFKDWKDDDDSHVKKVKESVLMFMNVNRFLLDADMRGVRLTLNRNFGLMAQLFTELAGSQKEYPEVGF
jgi:hypothetical protein